MTRRDFQFLANLRVKEAGLLVERGMEQGAYYLGGYAVECALKACIAKKTRRHEFPPKKADRFYSHELTALLKLAELDEELDKEISDPSKTKLAANWSVVKNWSCDSRYLGSGLNGKDLYTAITGADGVLAWIKQRW